jgi:hypothetical protein
MAALCVATLDVFEQFIHAHGKRGHGTGAEKSFVPFSYLTNSSIWSKAASRLAMLVAKDRRA